MCTVDTINSRQLFIFCVLFFDSYYTIIAFGLAVDCSSYPVAKRMIETKWYNVNYISTDKKIQHRHCPLTRVAFSTDGYDQNRPDQCELYRVWDLLLCQDEIDLSITSHLDENVIFLMQKNKTKHYTQLLKSKAQSNKYEWSKRFTFDMIDNEIKTNEKASELADAATSSDYDKIVSILENKENESIIPKLMNIRALNYVGSALVMSAFVVTDFDREDETNCKNYKCSKYLLGMKGVDLAAQCSRGATAFHYAGNVVVLNVFCLFCFGIGVLTGVNTQHTTKYKRFTR